MTRGVQPRPLRRARVVELVYTYEARDGHTRTSIKLDCGHVQRMTLAAFNRRGPWRVGQVRTCPRPHKRQPSPMQTIMRAARKAAGRG